MVIVSARGSEKHKGSTPKANDLMLRAMALRKGMSLDPKHPIDQLPFNLGRVGFLQGDGDACISWFRKVAAGASKAIAVELRVIQQEPQSSTRSHHTLRVTAAVPVHARALE